MLYLRHGTVSINICLTAQNVFLWRILLELWRWIQSIRLWYSLFSCCWLCYVLQHRVVAIMSVCTAVHKTQKQERFVLKNCIFSLIYVFKFFKLSYCLETKWTRSGYQKNELHCFVNKEGEYETAENMLSNTIIIIHSGSWFTKLFRRYDWIKRIPGAIVMCVWSNYSAFYCITMFWILCYPLLPLW